MKMFSAATSIGKETDLAFWVITGISAVLFILIIFFMLYFVYRYHHRRNPSASDIEGNSTLELSFMGISIVLVLAMFFWGWDGYKTMKGAAPAGSLEVKVTGQMWLWTFEYPDGRRLNELVLMKGAPVKLRLFSNDVIHSFYVPAFRIKQDIIPGSEKTVWFTPDAAGSFDLFCAEYCGTNHSSMITRAIVVEEADYNAWLAGKKELGAASKAKPSSKAALGKELYATMSCSACHSIDGSSGIGPTFKGLFGKKERVTTNGKERVVTVDEAYIMKSEHEPTADVVVGFQPVMPPSPLTDEEIGAVIEFIKTLK
ncbi:MAG: cytochrome c oxidase subunit II [Deltaproteobacteria bacterium]|nr:cytochrome c oxidase subunit II [Deltaproteobacteria bacterium]